MTDGATIPQVVLNGAASRAAPLLIVDDQQVSGGSFAARARAVAASLSASDIDAGDRVAILMPNSIDMLATIVGTMLAGALPAPLNLRYGPRDLAHVIGDCAPSALFVSEAPGRFRGLLERLRCCVAGLEPRGTGEPTTDGVVLARTGEVLDHRIFLQRGAGPRLAYSDAHPHTAATADALLLYTSGTTAAPRGCVLSHRAILGNARALARDVFRLTAADRLWNPLPFCHIGALMPFVACALSGAAFYGTAHFEAARAVDQLLDGCTIAHPSFETIWSPIMAEGARRAVALDHLRLVHLVGPPSRMATAHLALPHAEFVAGYGATETSGVVCMHRPRDSNGARLNTCGAPLPEVDVAVFDVDTGQALAPCAAGEIRVRGYPLLTRYWGADQRVSPVDGDGWFHTGDRGRMSPDGHLTFLGRIKDTLKVGGENVSALEVESCLGENPAVLLAQVVAAPDVRLGEVPMAFVQLAAGAQVTESDLIAFCGSRIASFKVPRRVTFVRDWPMSATKIQKSVLREWAASENR